VPIFTAPAVTEDAVGIIAFLRSEIVIFLEDILSVTTTTESFAGVTMVGKELIVAIF
jgi:hypothetical protein